MNNNNQLNVYFLDEISIKLCELCFCIINFYLVNKNEILILENIFIKLIKMYL